MENYFDLKRVIYEDFLSSFEKSLTQFIVGFGALLAEIRDIISLQVE